MANIIQIKRRTSGSAGAPGSLAAGELAYNEVDNKLYYGSDGGVVAIAGEGFYTTVNTSQVLSGSKTFTSSVVLSSAVAETKATATSAASVATTEFVQNVFSVLDGGDFDGMINGGGGGGGVNGRLNVPNDVTLVFSPDLDGGNPQYRYAWGLATEWYDVSGQPVNALPTNTDVVYISGNHYSGSFGSNPRYANSGLVIDVSQYSTGDKVYMPSGPFTYSIVLSASTPTNVPLSRFVGDGEITALENITLI